MPTRANGSGQKAGSAKSTGRQARGNRAQRKAQQQQRRSAFSISTSIGDVELSPVQLVRALRGQCGMPKHGKMPVVPLDETERKDWQTSIDALEQALQVGDGKRNPIPQMSRNQMQKTLSNLRCSASFYDRLRELDIAPGDILR